MIDHSMGPRRHLPSMSLPLLTRHPCCIVALLLLLLLTTSPQEALGVGMEGPLFESLSSSSTRGCPESYKKFEIMSGFAFSSPPDSFASIPVRVILLASLLVLLSTPFLFFPRRLSRPLFCLLCFCWSATSLAFLQRKAFGCRKLCEPAHPFPPLTLHSSSLFPSLHDCNICRCLAFGCRRCHCRCHLCHCLRRRRHDDRQLTTGYRAHTHAGLPGADVLPECVSKQ